VRASQVGFRAQSPHGKGSGGCCSSQTFLPKLNCAFLPRIRQSSLLCLADGTDFHPSTHPTIQFVVSCRRHRVPFFTMTSATLWGNARTSAAAEVLARSSLSGVSRIAASIPSAPNELETSPDIAMTPLERGSLVDISHSEDGRVSIETLRRRLTNTSVLESGPNESDIPTTMFARKFLEDGLPANCAYAMFEDSVFRQEVADGAWSILRLAVPSLVPWKWNLSIWSVNERRAFEHLSECIICPNSRGYYPSTLSTERGTKKKRQTMSLQFDCSRCDGAIHMSKLIPISLYIALGTGHLTKAQWLQILTSLSTPPIPWSVRKQLT
jgi:hypothetical protein